MDSVRRTAAISRMEVWSSRANAVRSAASARSWSRRAWRIFASRDQGRAGWIEGSGIEVVLLDQGHKVLDFGVGDVGEGERLDIARAAGGGMGDGAAVLQCSGEGGAGADFDGSVFDR